jgi:GntR family transcriptional regulator, histidine utilization repressor
MTPRNDRPGPTFQRVKEHLRAGIAAGTWATNQPLPSEAQLTEQFGVSRMTVNRALRELQQEGLIERIQGVGSFVAQLHRVASTLTLRDVHEEIIERGHVHTVQVLALEAMQANAVIARQLSLAAGSQVYHSIIVHKENEIALQREERWVNPAAAPDYLQQDFHQLTPTRYLLDVAPLSEAHFVIFATEANAIEARALGIDRGAACLRLERTTLSQGVGVSYVRLLHPGTRYVIRGEFRL